MADPLLLQMVGVAADSRHGCRSAGCFNNTHKHTLLDVAGRLLRLLPDMLIARVRAHISGYVSITAAVWDACWRTVCASSHVTHCVELDIQVLVGQQYGLLVIKVSATDARAIPLLRHVFETSPNNVLETLKDA